MKDIYIVEGVNDYLFLKEIIKNKTQKIKSYSNDTNQKLKKNRTHIRSGEKDALNSFTGPYSPHNILIKIENGNKNVFKFLPNIINITFNKKDIKIITLFDLDSDDADKIFKDVENKITSKILQQGNLQLINMKNDCDLHLHQRTYKLSKGNQTLFEINFLAFHSSLETEIYKKYNVNLHYIHNTERKTEIIVNYCTHFRPYDILLEL